MRLGDGTCMSSGYTGRGWSMSHVSDKDDEGDEYLVCDWCGHECQDFTSFFGDIRCDECAYEDETYRREILGERI